jgi:acyl carrier protein
MDHVEQTVHRVVLRIARQRSPAVSGVENGQHLTAELGLTSLDLARILAVLELELGADPFASLVAITDVRTVGDLCAAYKALSPSPESATSPAFTPSLDRAELRRSAQARRPQAGTSQRRDGDEEDPPWGREDPK